jgi:hypothetical protein
MMKHPTWKDVDWSNTHLMLQFGEYHFGIVDNDYGRYVALAVSQDEKRPVIVLLNDDDVDEFSRMLRQTAKAL